MSSSMNEGVLVPITVGAGPFQLHIERMSILGLGLRAFKWESQLRGDSMLPARSPAVLGLRVLHLELLAQGTHVLGV